MTKKELEQVYYLDRELKMWEEELNRLRSQSFVRSPTFRAVRGEGIYDKVGERAQKTADLEAKILAKREEIQNAREEILKFLADIPDSLTRMTAYYHCVKLMSWQRVAVEIGGCNTAESVRKLYARFLKSAALSDEPAEPAAPERPAATDRGINPAPRPRKKNPHSFFRSTMDFPPDIMP